MRRTVTLAALVLIAACDRNDTTGPATRPGIAPHHAAFDLATIGIITGQTEITSNGVYVYSVCDFAFGDDMSGEHWVMDKDHSSWTDITWASGTFSPGCLSDSVNITTSTQDFEIEASATGPLGQFAGLAWLTVHNYTRPLISIVGGSTTVNTGASCEYNLVITGGKPPYTNYSWEVDGVLVSGSGSQQFVTFSSDGPHTVAGFYTDALGHNGGATLPVTSETQDPPHRGCDAN